MTKTVTREQTLVACQALMCGRQSSLLRKGLNQQEQKAGSSISPLQNTFMGLVCFLKKSSFTIYYSIRKPARHVDFF